MNKASCGRGPSFFKVLFGDFIDRLQIPPAFVKNLDGAFPLKCSICDSGGRCWRVEIDRYDNDLYFYNGWKEFMEDNCLEIGDFLVFRCHGSSEFSVKIFGKSCCEREVELDHREEGGVGETMFTSCGVRDVGSKTRSGDTGVAAWLGSMKQEKEGENAGGQATKELFCRIGSRNQANLGAAHRKTNFTSELPPYRAVMRPACLHTGKMVMPSYLRNYAEHQQLVKLKISNKTWTAKFNMYRKVCILGEGWARFVRENNLKEGNMCIFEVIDTEDVTLAVSIIR